MTTPRDELSRPAAVEGAARLGSLADLLAEADVLVPDPDQLITLTARAVPASSRACLSLTTNGRLQVLACTDDLARRLDELQVELAEGPMFDIDGGNLVRAEDLARSADRWPRFAPAAAELGARDALAVRVGVEGVGRASLSLYADTPEVFVEADHEVATVCGSLLALGLRGARDRERAANLEVALESNRLIGVAIGILMARTLATSEQAFDALRGASQRLHRKLRDVAEEVVSTGQLP